MTDAATNMSPAWIKRAMELNPCTLTESGDVRTCPVRLSFPFLFKKQPPMDENGEPKYAATLLFPFGADISVLRREAKRVADEKGGAAKGGPAITSPFRDQADKADRFEGYVPGAFFLTCTSTRRVPVVDTRNIPVVDEEKVYPGVWVIATLRPFYYARKVKRGVSFGLQAVMLFADDKQLGGGSVDPQKAFAGVNVIEVDNSLSLDDLM